MKEIFKDIAGYEGLYQVSNLGRVKSLGNDKLRKEKILKQKLNRKYYEVSLSKNGTSKKFKVHRLVARVFLKNPDNLPQVNHIDQNTQNNRLDNLEFCSQEDNIKFSQPNSYIKVGCYKNGELIKIYPSIGSTEKDGFNKGTVSRCCRKVSGYRSHKGYQWKYVE